MKLILTSKKDIQQELTKAEKGASFLSIDSGCETYLIKDEDLSKFVEGKLRQGFQCVIFNPVELQRPKTIIETIPWNNVC